MKIVVELEGESISSLYRLLMDEFNEEIYPGLADLYEELIKFWRSYDRQL